MKEQREKADFTETNILSIPKIILDMAGILDDSDLVVEVIPGVVLIGIKPEDVEAAIRKD